MGDASASDRDPGRRLRRHRDRDPAEAGRASSRSRSSSARAKSAGPGATTPIPAPPATFPPTSTRSRSSPTRAGRASSRRRARSRPTCSGSSRNGSCASKLRLNTEIVEARFDEARGIWTLTTAAGATHEARVVVSGVGGLVDPATPDIKGLQSFGGEMFHTARWNHEYDLTGRNVAVIGTGASAVQVVPSIAPQVAKLSVFQRTPAWVVPKLDKGYSEHARERYARHPLRLRASRLAQYGLSELLGPMIFLDSKRLSAIGEGMSLRHLRAQVQDPELRRKLTPTLSVRLQAHPGLGRLLGELRARQRRAGDRADRRDPARGHRDAGRSAARGRRDRARHRLRGEPRAGAVPDQRPRRPHARRRCGSGARSPTRA